MAYTTVDNPELYFQAKLYNGNGGTQSITLDGTENMQPDWVWCKGRNFADNHISFDSVRGATKVFKPNLDNAETTVAATLTSFDSDGFSLGSDGEINQNNKTFVAWNWKAGGSASSNSDGSITTSVNVNQTAGFSIITYTGSNSDTTIGHGLGVKPNLFIIKSRSNANAWIMGGDKIGSDNNGTLFLAETDAVASTDTNFNNTAPTSSVITLRNTNSQANRASYTYVCYAFADIKGYSKFGSYSGNGNADGPFVYTGFLPAFVMWKRTDAANDWMMGDNKITTFNPKDGMMRANLTNAELSTNPVDFLSNGFKIRLSGNAFNNSSGTYIYMAFAESPFVNSKGVPNNAK